MYSIHVCMGVIVCWCSDIGVLRLLLMLLIGVRINVHIVFPSLHTSRYDITGRFCREYKWSRHRFEIVRVNSFSNAMNSLAPPTLQRHVTCLCCKPPPAHAALLLRLFPQNAHRKVLDMANILGLSNSILRVADRREAVDRLLVLGGVIVTSAFLWWMWSRRSVS